MHTNHTPGIAENATPIPTRDSQGRCVTCGQGATRPHQDWCARIAAANALHQPCACGRPHYGLGLCKLHWTREYRARRRAAA